MYIPAIYVIEYNNSVNLYIVYRKGTHQIQQKPMNILCHLPYPPRVVGLKLDIHLSSPISFSFNDQVNKAENALLFLEQGSELDSSFQTQQYKYKKGC